MTEKEEKKVQDEIERSFKMGYTKALWEEGFTASAIAARLGVAVSTIRSWMKKMAAQFEVEVLDILKASSFLHAL